MGWANVLTGSCHTGDVDRSGLCQLYNNYGAKPSNLNGLIPLHFAISDLFPVLFVVVLYDIDSYKVLVLGTV